MVATTQLRLALEIEDEIRARLEYLSDKLGIVLVSTAFVKIDLFSSFDPFGSGKILRLWL